MHDYLPDTVDSKNLIIEVDFIFLNNQIIKNLKKIFSKYQISVHQILSYEYLESLNNLNYKDITKVANDNIDIAGIYMFIIIVITIVIYYYDCRYHN